MLDFGDLAARLQAALGDRYEVEAPAGFGGAAVVFRARDLRHDRMVALKVFRPDIAVLVGTDRFLREIRMVASLSHPHILPLFDSGEADGLLFYVMPWVDGGSLRERIDRVGALDIREAVTIGRAVCLALDYAHRQGIVHRDIKPDNIMMNEGVAMVADFGIGKAMSDVEENDRLTMTGTAIGTPTYMSPEQVTNDYPVDGRSDIYALACVMYELVSGEPPFHGPTALSIAARHTTDAPTPLSKRRDAVPWRVEHAVARGLAKTPGERFETAIEFAAALERASGAMSGQLEAITDVDRSKAIVVLPFVNTSGDPKDEHLSDGITEELIHELARLKRLHVVGRTSSFSFKDKDYDIKEIGKRLHVDAVLEGSVRRANDRLRITAQLADAHNGYELWSERYERETGDVFAIQDDIAGSIVRTLEPTLVGNDTARPKQPTNSFSAYESYLRGRYCWNQRTLPALRQSVEYLERAIAEDPSFALARAGLAESYVTMAIYGIAPGEVMPLARAAAEAALEKGGEMSEALTPLACVKALYDWDWSGAETDFRRATEANTSYSTAHHWYAINLLAPLGRVEDARAELELARAIDPISPAVAASLGFVDFLAGAYDEALERLGSVLAIFPDFRLANYFRGQVHLARGSAREAIEDLECAASGTSSAETLAMLAHARAVSGDEAGARNDLAALEQRMVDGYVSPALICQVHAGLGDMDAAFAALDEAIVVRSTELVWLTQRPVYASLRDDPRYAARRDRIFGTG